MCRSRQGTRQSESGLGSLTTEWSSERGVLDPSTNGVGEWSVKSRHRPSHRKVSSYPLFCYLSFNNKVCFMFGFKIQFPYGFMYSGLFFFIHVYSCFGFSGRTDRVPEVSPSFSKLEGF